jgi:hypothetical protein
MNATTLAELNSAVRSILSDNTKLRKLPSGAEVINAGLTFAPAKRSGIVNVCPHATAACIAACVLWFAGRTVTDCVRNAAIARTRLWHFDPTTFYRRLHRALAALGRRAAKLGVRAFVRLNVASDIAHPAEVMERHPDITGYDYTKSVQRCRDYATGKLPSNYHLSYSLHEHSRYDDVAELLAAGVNVVVVFDTHYFGPRHRYGILPATATIQRADGSGAFTVKCVDGDAHDLRVPEFDGRGVVVGLRLKGGRNAKRRAIESGFARHVSPESSTVYLVDELRMAGNATLTLADTPATVTLPIV